MQKFVDDKIEHKESDIEKIQTKPNMYISYLGQRGSLHLLKEIINNAIDECINPNSPGNEVDIYLDEVENIVSVSDNGRGFPFEDMEVSCTKIQAGSKFYRVSGSGSAGENGVGMTAVNALSSLFEIVSRRYGEKATIKFIDGKLEIPTSVKKVSSDKHGTTVTFQPSAKRMAKSEEDDASIKPQMLMEWLEKIILVCPNHITINLCVNCKGKESAINKKYRNKKGMLTMCEKLTEKPILDPIQIMKSITFPELDQEGKEVERFMGLEVAFALNSKPGTEPVIESFCNFVNTIDHGEHVNAAKVAITQYLGKMTRESLSKREADSLDITNQDIQNSLVLAVNLSTTVAPEFTGQTKEKVSNTALFQPLRKMTYNGLDEHFRKNPKELKRMTDAIKTNAKARLAATKARNSVIRGETTKLDEFLIKKYAPANATGKNDYRELFIVEGDSAGGSAKAGRFKDFQAVFPMRGVPLNAFGLKLDKVLSNDEFRTLVQILKTNIGAAFDITKCQFKKIIIMTDGDVDGSRIFSLLCAFFLAHMPELVKQGYIYKAVAPLYNINDKKNPFALNKLEYIKVFERHVSEALRLTDVRTSVVLNHDKMTDFLFRNREYLDELERFAKYYGLHNDVAEFLAIYAGTPAFEKVIKVQFPELTFDSDNVVSGVYNGEYQIAVIGDKSFKKKVASMRALIHEVNEGNVYYHVHEKVGKEYVERGTMTIGQFMYMAKKFQPKIITRYKGLGELNSDQLADTTLDPDNRILIKLTLEDLEEEMKKFKVLHGDSSEERKKLMEHFKISRDDIDN